MITFFELLARVVSMKFKPEQKPIRSLSHQQSSQKALFSGFKEHRHGVETWHWGFESKSQMPFINCLWYVFYGRTKNRTEFHIFVCWRWDQDHIIPTVIQQYDIW